MILGAVVLVGSDYVTFGDFSPSDLVPGSSRLAPTSVAMMDVLGRSVLDRVTENLQQAGVNSISLVCESRLASSSALPKGDSISSSFFSSSSEFLSLVEEKVSDQIEQGASVVLLLSLDSYMEFEFGDVLEFHRDRGQMITRVRDGEGPMNFWVIDAARARESSLSIVSVLRGRSSSRSYHHLRGYSNRLHSAQDLRELVSDSFQFRCRLHPAGTEVRPGVWVDKGAAVHRQARLVAPVYIGRNCQVEAGALITRGSNLEAGCHVGGGTVVDKASVLAHTYLGSGLEISQSVVERGHLMHLKRNVTVNIADSSLIGATQPQSGYSFLVEPVAVPLQVAARNQQFGLPGRLSEAFGD